MNDQELLGLLMNRGWRRYGITDELVISSDSQRIVTRAQAAALESIDPTKDFYAVLETQD